MIDQTFSSQRHDCVPSLQQLIFLVLFTVSFLQLKTLNVTYKDSLKVEIYVIRLFEIRKCYFCVSWKIKQEF